MGGLKIKEKKNGNFLSNSESDYELYILEDHRSSSHSNALYVVQRIHYDGNTWNVSFTQIDLLAPDNNQHHLMTRPASIDVKKTSDCDEYIK